MPEQSFAIAASEGMTFRDDMGALREGGRQTLRAGGERAGSAGLEIDEDLRDELPDRVCDQVVDAASQSHADLIAIGTHGRRGMRRTLLGSDAENILRLSQVPVPLVWTPDVP